MTQASDPLEVARKLGATLKQLDDKGEEKAYLEGGEGFVYLIVPVTAATPKQAVQEFKQIVMNDGLGHMTYAVMDADGSRWLTDGFGELLDPTELVDDQDA